MATAPILSWEGLGLIQGSGWLFQDIDLHIGPRDRLALIGRNGAGKTTLLKLIAGQIEADRGTRSVQPGTRIVMLEQDPFFTGFATLMDFALSGDDAPPRHEVEAIAGQLGIDLSRDANSASGGERRRAALCPRAGQRARPAAARRADQPSRSRRDRLAGGLAAALQGRVRRDQP